MAPKHPCNGCQRVLLPRGISRCPRCQGKADARAREGRRAYEARRPPRATPTYDPRWRGLRVAFLRQHPRCAVCGAEAVEVHHRVPARVRPDLALEWSNLIALCRPDHTRATNAERAVAAKCAK